MQANKDGFYYVLDRVTGQFISGQPFAQVTWAKGLNEETGRPIINPEAHYGTDSITLAPGPGGGHNWSPMSFNPATGLVYIPTSTNSSSTYAIDTNFTYKPGQSNTGLLRAGRGGGAAGAGAAPAAPQPVAAKLPSPQAIGPVPQEGQRGVLLAWDPVTQKERWRANGGGSIGGGTVTTAGNLVIQVVPDGRLVAYSADKGEKLLDVQTGLRGGMGPPITYLIDGKQYISLMGGQGTVVARNAEAAATGAAAAAPVTPPALPKLLTFVLDGKGTLPATAP
jgi:quinohemoprotein ethanol dehydrogenase